jgi:hypothetical protein
MNITPQIFEVIQSCLDNSNKRRLQSSLILVFPLIDALSKEKYPSIGKNKDRIVKFINENFNNMYLLRYSPNTYPIQN